MKLKEMNKLFHEYICSINRNWFPSHGHATLDQVINGVTAIKSEFEKNSGIFHKTISILPDISEDKLKQWEMNGIFNGMMAGFLLYLENPDKAVNMISNFVFHYFKYDNLFAIDFSDKDLNAAFNYRDEVFHRSIEPHLKKVFDDKDDIWVRHFDESKVFELDIYPLQRSNLDYGARDRTKFCDDGCWPKWYWSPYGDFYSVEVGRFGYSDCIHRLIENTEGDHLKSFIGNRNVISTQGIISLRSLSCIMTKKPRLCRDHYVLDLRIPFRDWVFLDAPPYGDDLIGYVDRTSVIGLLSIIRKIIDIVRFCRLQLA